MVDDARPPVSPGQGRGAVNCRYAIPTIFADTPVWFDAEAAPWTCVRDDEPGVIEDTVVCASCPRWRPALVPDFRQS